jgi:hypothetical protein
VPAASTYIHTFPTSLGSAKLTGRCAQQAAAAATAAAGTACNRTDTKNLRHKPQSSTHLPTKRPDPCTTCIRPPHCTSCAQTTVRAPHTKETPGSLCTHAFAPHRNHLQSQQTPVGCQEPAHTRPTATATTHKQHHPLPCITAAYTRDAPPTSRAQGASQAAAAVTTQGSQCC